jgi:hypothetical protein
MSKRECASQTVTEHSRSILGRKKESKGLAGLVTSARFDLFFSILIVANVVAMALEAQYDGEDIGALHKLAPGSPPRASEVWPPSTASAFAVVQNVLGSFFALELFLKVIGLREIWPKDLMNWLDLCVVSFWTASLCGLGFASTTQFVRFVRLVKLLRLLKLLRNAESLDALFLMSTAIRGSFSILAWTLLIFVSALTIFALVMCHTLVFYFEDASQSLESRRQLWIYFGTFSRSLFTMFELTFANWPPVARLLTENVHECFMVLTVVYKMTLGFAIVAVINGVFMQETFKAAALDDNIMVRQRSRAAEIHRDKMTRLFKSVDTSDDGLISLREFADFFRDKELKLWLTALECPIASNVSEVEKIFAFLDTDCDGQISLAELVQGVAHLKGTARSWDVAFLTSTVQEIRESLQLLLRSRRSGDIQLKGHAIRDPPQEAPLEQCEREVSNSTGELANMPGVLPELS